MVAELLVKGGVDVEDVDELTADFVLDADADVELVVQVVFALIAEEVDEELLVALEVSCW